MQLILNEDGPWLDFKTRDGSHASINLRRYAEEKNDPILLAWCEEQLGRPLRRSLQAIPARQ